MRAQSRLRILNQVIRAAVREGDPRWNEIMHQWRVLDIMARDEQADRERQRKKLEEKRRAEPPKGIVIGMKPARLRAKRGDDVDGRR